MKTERRQRDEIGGEPL